LVKDALKLDIHHTCEQVSRSARFHLFGFNGTGGIWRKQAIADAGGFTWETVTEDLLMSYRAYMKGYKLVYIRDFPQCLEVPPDLLAHMQQKHRWTQGFVQVFCIYFWELLTTKHIQFCVKFEFCTQMLGSFGFFMAIFAQCIIVHLHSPSLVNSWLFTTVFSSQVCVQLATNIFAVYAKVGTSNGCYSTFLSRLARLRFIVPSGILQGGMAVFECSAALDGLLSDDATFLTTPKKGSPTLVKPKRRDDIDAFLGMLMALQLGVVGYANDPSQHVKSVAIRYLWRFYSCGIVFGLTVVSTTFLWVKHCK
jgi:hypothetical protein